MMMDVRRGEIRGGERNVRGGEEEVI